MTSSQPDLVKEEIDIAAPAAPDPAPTAADAGRLDRSEQVHAELTALLEELAQVGLVAGEIDKIVKRLSILTPDRRAKLTPLSGTAEVVPVVHRGDPRGFV